MAPSQQAKYAEVCGTTIGYLRKAMSKGQRFDGALVRLLHIESAGAVSLTDLRPDIWPTELVGDRRYGVKIADLVASAGGSNALWAEEHRDGSTHAAGGGVSAQGGEPHPFRESNEFAHEDHGDGRKQVSGTMKRGTFQGDPR